MLKPWWTFRMIGDVVGAYLAELRVKEKVTLQREKEIFRFTATSSTSRIWVLDPVSKRQTEVRAGELISRCPCFFSFVCLWIPHVRCSHAISRSGLACFLISHNLFLQFFSSISSNFFLLLLHSTHPTDSASQQTYDWSWLSVRQLLDSSIDELCDTVVRRPNMIRLHKNWPCIFPLLYGRCQRIQTCSCFSFSLNNTYNYLFILYIHTQGWELRDDRGWLQMSRARD